MAEDYHALARRWFEDNWNARREAVIDELVAPAAIGHMEGGDVRGREEFRNVRATLLGAFPDLRLLIEDSLVEGSQVAVRWRVNATHRGDHLGFAAVNKPANFRGITWLKFESGQIVEGWDARNQGALLQALQAPSS